MSLADSTINKLELHGPEGLLHILASMRMYLFRYFFFNALSHSHADRN
jgi:hypothetical protein